MIARAARAPRHAVRATRSAGQRMRTRLLECASDLFKARGLGAVAITEIAAAADAFPSQITYYFGTKEALFVEAACRDVLHAAHAAEQAAHAAAGRDAYFRALVDGVMRNDALGFFVEAMTLSRRRPDLAHLIARTVQRLHDEGLRAYATEVAARGWPARQDPALVARRFWTIAIGVTVEGQAVGRPPDDLVADMVSLLEVRSDSEGVASDAHHASMHDQPDDGSNEAWRDLP